MKRLFCIVLAVFVLMLSTFAVTVAAEDTTNPDCIYFQVPTSDGVAWKNFSVVFCHIWQEGDEGGDFYAWQAKDERCTDLGNGYWSYDISEFDFKEDGTYSVIFSNENGMQTYNLSITSDCKGDIVYCDGETCVNPVDSEKQCTVARWMENNETVHPCAVFGSDGTLVDPDSIFNTDAQLKWGSSEGVSITMPEVEVVEEVEETESLESQTDVLTTGETASGSSLSIGFIVAIIVAVVVVAVVGAVVLVLVLSKRKKAENS